MDHRRNPFQELYVTETVRPDSFIKLFSDFLVEHALAIFQPGNVIVRGVQGSGKSMILNLLKPEIRLAYMAANEEFPIPQNLSRFVSGGINLTRSPAVDFGQRSIEGADQDDLQMLPLYFADFLNYWIVVDILHTVDTLSANCTEMGLEREHLDSFAEVLASKDCWFGYLEGVQCYSDLGKKLNGRVRQYCDFLNFNTRELDDAVKSTKTSIGEPISRVAEALWESHVVPKDMPFFVRIDQYEELGRLEGWCKESGTSVSYTRVVNKLLGRRDPRVSFRIGTRRYGWTNDLRMYGTGSQLEQQRDYGIVDLDAILRRRENRRDWVFPQFAEDVFRRRLRHAEYELQAADAVKDFFGGGENTKGKALQYARNATRLLVSLPRQTPEAWRKGLSEIAGKNPLEAKLAEAWFCQQSSRKKAMPRFPSKPFPWNRDWWKKERVQQGLMQIAAACQQRMVWEGYRNVLQLSGGNILIFLTICKEVWEAWSRAQRGKEEQSSEPSTALPEIDLADQAVGIDAASNWWYSKIREHPGGAMRQRFLHILAGILRDRMLKDKAMSYPGHNGFSIRESELDTNQEMSDFLNDAVDYGDLVDAKHTTKEKDRRSRRKWYLHPILSPYFQLPSSHIKEPLYVPLAKVAGWREDALHAGPLRRQHFVMQGPKIERLPLFDEEEQE